MDEKKVFGIIILAAGNSSRLGQPKQLLRYRNKTLIRLVAEAALEAIRSPVVVVTGSFQEPIVSELGDLPVHFVHNDSWLDGMASSIRAGLVELIQLDRKIQGAIIAVSDQPFVSTDLFLNLIQKAEVSKNAIVASAYGNTNGTPVLFDKMYFDAILALQGTEGAKKLLTKFGGDVETIPFPDGAIDIDTIGDYQKLVNT